MPGTGWSDFGTGSLGDMGCHFIDVPYRALLLGCPVTVTCSVRSVYSGFFYEKVYTDSYPPSSVTYIQFPARDDKSAVEVIWYDGGTIVVGRRKSTHHDSEPANQFVKRQYRGSYRLEL